MEVGETPEVRPEREWTRWCWKFGEGETPEVRPEGNGPGGVGSLGKPEEIGEVVVGNGEAWGVGGGSWGDT